MDYRLLYDAVKQGSRLVNFKELGRKWSWFISIYCIGIHLEWLRKISNTLCLDYLFETFTYRRKVRIITA